MYVQVQTRYSGHRFYFRLSCACLLQNGVIWYYTSEELNAVMHSKLNSFSCDLSNIYYHSTSPLSALHHWEFGTLKLHVSCYDHAFSDSMLAYFLKGFDTNSIIVEVVKCTVLIFL